MFKKNHMIIKKEHKTDNEKISKIVLKELNEIEEIKNAIERKNNEERRKRGEVRIFVFKTIKLVTVYENYNNVIKTLRRQIEL